MKALWSRLGRNDDEGGFTLIEVLVTVSILTVFMGIFATAVISITQVTTKQQSVSDSQTQVDLALQKLDSQVRYAAYITTPGVVNNSAYVELYSQNQKDSSGNAVKQCTQIRLNSVTDNLEERTWVTTGAAATPTAWQLLAPRMVNVLATTPPFVVQQATSATASPTATATGTASPTPVSSANVPIRQQITFTLQGGTVNNNSAKNAVSLTALTFTASNYDQTIADSATKPCGTTEVART